MRMVVSAVAALSLLASACGDDTPVPDAVERADTSPADASATTVREVPPFGEGTATPPVVVPGGTVRITPAVAVEPLCGHLATVYDGDTTAMPLLGLLDPSGAWSGPDTTLGACLEQTSAAGTIYRVPDDWSGAYVFCLTNSIPEPFECATVEVAPDGASFDDLPNADTADPCGVLFTDTEYTSDRTCSIVDWNLLSTDGATLELEYFANDPGCSGELDHVGVQETVDDVTLTVYVEHLAGPGVTCPTAFGSSTTTVQLQEPLGDKPLYGCRPELSFVPAGGYNAAEPRDPARDCAP
jgi:hypothetical protein